jgi:hypothetical protein
MIISHKHKFIFIKTAKTAGTSIEIALSKYCGKRDVITPIYPEKDELTRKSLGYRGPQNYLVPFRMYSRSDWMSLVRRRERLAFYNHAPASFIRRYIPAEVWQSYFKFCFERNPWDKAVSFYCWKNQEEARPSIGDFIRSEQFASMPGMDLYTIDQEVVVDRVCSYERIGEEMQKVAAIIGLPEAPALPRAKANVRKDDRTYRDILGDHGRREIARLFSREIELFGYSW